MKVTKTFKLLPTTVVYLLIQKMLGKVSGVLQHKDSKKCVNFGVMSNPPLARPAEGLLDGAMII